MAVFASDNFTDTAGTILDAHTPSGGGTWTEHSNYGSSEAVISDVNRLRGNVATASCYYHSGAPATAEYDVDLDVHVITDPAALHEHVVGRINTGADTMYGVRRNTSGQWQLYKIVTGTLTSLGTFSQTLTVGVSYRVKLEIRDAAKKVYIDGVERISSADNAITAAGKAGVRFNGRVTSNSTDRHLDNFEASDPGGGGSPQDANLTGIPSAEAFGTPRIDTDITFAGIASAEAFGTVRVDQSINFTGIPSAEAFGSGVLNLTVPLTGIPSAEAFGSLTIDGGEQPEGPQAGTMMQMGVGR